MATPRISLLIPFKNVENYFEKCLVSIHQQTYGHWEVIAVDDHSDDSSLQIVQRFSQLDNRFKIFSNSASGIISALRLAYSQSSGQFISRMDADDHMAIDRLEIMASALVENGKGNIALGQVRYFSDKGVNDGYRRYEKWLNQLTVKGSNYQEIYKECVIPSPCWMVHRSDLDASGAFDSDRYPEDYDLAFRFYAKGLTCIPCTTILHYWRDYPTRTSRTSEHYAHNFFLEIKLHYFLKLDYDPTKTLVVWGAGKKGKDMAKKLINLKLDFKWVCDNPKKIGKDIYGIQLNHYKDIQNFQRTQAIVTVANEKEQRIIKIFFKELAKISSVEYFFFC